MTAPRTPDCLSEVALVQLDAGELAADRVDAAQAHADACPRCTATLVEIRADRAALAGTTPLWLGATPRRRSPAVWLAVPVLLAAAAALVVVLRPSQAPDVVRDDGVRVKGDGLVLEIYVNHAGVTRRAAADEPVVAGDRIRFALRSPTSGASSVHAAVFSLDGADQASVYATADVPLDPTSRELPGAIALDATLGIERLIALACVPALDVEKLRTQLAATGALATPTGCMRADATLRKVAP